MSKKAFIISVSAIGILFSFFFVVTVIPPLLEHFDPIGAFAAGFVNPYAAGYSTDVIACWLILVIWIIYERPTKGVRHGWVCALLAIVPGVAVGFAGYLVLRLRQSST